MGIGITTNVESLLSIAWSAPLEQYDCWGIQEQLYLRESRDHGHI